MEKIVLLGLFGRPILTLIDDQELLVGLSHAAPKFQGTIHNAESEAELLDLQKKSPNAAAIIIEVNSPISSRFELVDKILANGPNTPPLFFVSDKRDAHYDQAFLQGVDVILFKPVVINELLKGIAYALAMLNEQHAQRQHERKRLKRARVHLTAEKSGISANGYVVNISVGGMFICTTDKLPAAMEMITFKVIYSGDETIELSGKGLVKWSRSEIEIGRPPGLGVEFKDLDENAKKLVDRLVAKSQAG